MKDFIAFSKYIGLKWILFYIYQFSEGDVKWNFGNANGEGIFLAVFMLFILPLVELVILFFPFYLALRQRGWATVFILIVTFGLEFLMSFIATNYQYQTWMLIKIFLSAIIFSVIYRKRLRMQFS